MKLAVVGGGPSGLYLSILIKRRQPHAQVLVVEQNGADSTFGFGVVLADSGLHRLQAADEQVYQQLIERMTFNGTQNIQVNETPIELIHPGKGGAIARIDLLRVLQKTAHELGVDVRHGVRIEHPDALAQLGWGDADVVVGADGVNSVVRAAHESSFGATRASLTNHFAWFGTGKVFERSALVFRQWKGGSFVAHYYAYCSTGSTFVAECDDNTWERLGMGSMTDGQRQALCEEIFAPELKGHGLISNHSNWRQFPLIQTQKWHVGNQVLIGDAQTSAHFSIGSGTRIAMEDAIALADALTTPPAAGEAIPTSIQRLQRFALVRGPEKEKLLGASRKSYTWYENMGQWMQQYTPHEFVYAFMTRTGRMSDHRLAQQYPSLYASWVSLGVAQTQTAPDPAGQTV
jgi:2-polyprenyl-6-methoxyphenol hydroxylase-like FAD-dependent oxidoreductase